MQRTLKKKNRKLTTKSKHGKRFEQTLYQRGYTRGKYICERLEFSLLGNGVYGFFPFLLAKYN